MPHWKDESRITVRNMHKKGRAISDNHIKGTSKDAMRVHGMLGKETNLNPAFTARQF
jgi:hypothetical protein